MSRPADVSGTAETAGAAGVGVAVFGAFCVPEQPAHATRIQTSRSPERADNQFIVDNEAVTI